MNYLDKKTLIEWLSNKRNYAKGNLKNENISDDDYNYYTTQNGLLGDVINKIKSG